jgi:hypothetical protein
MRCSAAARVIGLGCELEDQMHRMPGLFTVALAEPRQGVTDRIDGTADGFGPRLHQVDVLRIAQRLLEQQLVDRGAAAEGNLALQRRRVEQIAQRTADDQVLFDLP